MLYKVLHMYVFLYNNSNICDCVVRRGRFLIETLNYSI